MRRRPTKQMMGPFRPPLLSKNDMSSLRTTTTLPVLGRVLDDTWVMQTSRWSGHGGLLEAKVSGPRAPGYAISSLHLFNERENSIR